MVTSPNQLLVHAKEPGRISMFVWDRAGSIQRYEVAVQRDLARLAADIKQLLPGEPIEVRGNGKFVILSGTVTTKEAAERAVNLATGFVDAREEVVTLLQVQPGAADASGAAARPLRGGQPRGADRVRPVAVHEPDRRQQHRRSCHDPAVRRPPGSRSSNGRRPAATSARR